MLDRFGIASRFNLRFMVELVVFNWRVCSKRFWLGRIDPKFETQHDCYHQEVHNNDITIAEPRFSLFQTTSSFCSITSARREGEKASKRIVTVIGTHGKTRGPWFDISLFSFYLAYCQTPLKN
jgi:hypothetical protein